MKFRTTLLLFLGISFYHIQAQYNSRLQCYYPKPNLKYYYIKIGNDTCKVYINESKNDSLIATTWLTTKNQTNWKTKLHKSVFKTPLNKFKNRLKHYKDTLAPQETSLGHMTQIEIKSIDFNDLVFDGIELTSIRANRLQYNILFYNQKTKQHLLFETGILCSTENGGYKTTKEKIMIFGIVKVTNN